MKQIIYETTKRILDIIFSVIGILVLFPVIVVTAILIKITSKGSIIYKQERIGKSKKKIIIYKFKTMVKDADKIEKLPQNLKQEYKENYKIEQDPRITKLGKVLRRWNIDEIPQLFNVLKGDMSLIGPRPVIPEELEKYKENIEKFVSVKPGLSGYWQVNKLNCKTYEDRIKMELYYIENRSFIFDFKIVLQTFLVIGRTVVESISNTKKGKI